MPNTLDAIWLGIGRFLVPIPGFIWKRQFQRDQAEDGNHLHFLPLEHRLVRNYVVRELPRTARPIPPDQIALDLGLSPARAGEILEQLERHMTFLFRNPEGAVAWAYPVTVDPTPHRVTFDSGEKLYAA